MRPYDVVVPYSTCESLGRSVIHVIVAADVVTPLTTTFEMTGCRRTRTFFGADGFYATGDLGRLDAEGYLWYAGRRDDMFKVKGATVYPAEVEAGLRAIPGVAQAFVTDVAGEVAALVVSKSADAETLAAAARERLSAFKVPALWLVESSGDAVPMSATGKVDKRALQELLRTRGGRMTR